MDQTINDEQLVRILLMGLIMHKLMPDTSGDALLAVPKLRELADAIISEAKRAK